MRSKKRKSKQELINPKLKEETSNNNEAENIQTVSPKVSKSKIPIPIQKKEEAEIQTQQEKSDIGVSNEILTANSQIVCYFFLLIKSH